MRLSTVAIDIWRKTVALSYLDPITAVGGTWATAGNFPGESNVEILLILFWLLTMQCKLTFTKLSSLSKPLVCAG